MLGTGSSTGSGYMAPRQNSNASAYVSNIGGSGRAKSPTESYYANNGYGTRNYSSLPPVPFADTEFGKYFGQGKSFFGALNAPQEASLQATGNNLSGNFNLLNANFGAQSGYMRAGFDNQMAQLGVNIAGNQAEQNAARALMNINYGGYRTATGDIASQAMQQRRAASIDATARGAYSNVGTGQDFRDIDTNREFALAKAETQYQTQQNSVARNMIQLDTQAKIYGLKPAEFANQLQQGLTKLGIDQTMSLSSLLNMIGSNNYQQAVLGQNILERALGFATEQMNS